MTAVPYLLCQLGAFCICFLYLSFFEWAFHRYVFHTPKVNRLMFRAHTLVHHQIYKSDDTYHTQDPHPDHVPMNWWSLPAIIAAHLPLFLMMQWATSVPVVGGSVLAICAYYAIYESIHWAMHVPRAARFLGRFPVYRFLDAHHRTHHKYLLSNLNVVLPLADLAFGTLRTADGRRVRLFQRSRDTTLAHSQTGNDWGRTAAADQSAIRHGLSPAPGSIQTMPGSSGKR